MRGSQDERKHQQRSKKCKWRSSSVAITTFVIIPTHPPTRPENPKPTQSPQKIPRLRSGQGPILHTQCFFFETSFSTGIAEDSQKRQTTYPKSQWTSNCETQFSRHLWVQKPELRFPDDLEDDETVQRARAWLSSRGLEVSPSPSPKKRLSEPWFCTKALSQAVSLSPKCLPFDSAAPNWPQSAYLPRTHGRWRHQHHPAASPRRGSPESGRCPGPPRWDDRKRWAIGDWAKSWMEPQRI